MQAQKLIELLKDLDPTDEVYIAQPTGDYWRHVKILNVDNADWENIEQSSYCESLILVDPEEDRVSGKHETVFILSC